jgi:rod shape-determining protein MreC
MDFLLGRYRNLLILLAAILAQLVLLAYQVKTQQDVRLIRVWAVTAVTPLARVLEGLRGSGSTFIREYLMLAGAQGENRYLRSELDRLKMENQFLRTELATAQRAEALAAFQKRTQSKTLAARVIGTSTGTNSKVVFIDRGSTSGVMKGMAVVTPDGIVGKVVASYPTASQVQLITDPSFAAGVVSQKHGVVGTLKGQGRADCIIDYVQIEQTLEQGEWFYTSGDDRVFPKGLPAGQVTAVRMGTTFKEIFVTPSAFQRGLEEVLVVVEGVHQQIPADLTQAAGERKLLDPPPGGPAAAPLAAQEGASAGTELDRLKGKYQAIGGSQNHKFGEGFTAPDFNKAPKPAAPPASAVSPAPGTGGASGTPPPVNPPDQTKPSPSLP